MTTRALLRGAGDESLPEGWWCFADPEDVLRADAAGGVRRVLGEVEAAARQGLWAVGFVAYEAAPAFDSALLTSEPAPGVPAAWFGLFPPPRPAAEPAAPAGAAPPPLDLAPTVSTAEHRAAFEAIRAAIARGDTYQANLTYRVRGALPDRTPEELFAALCRAQPSPYSTYLELGPGEPAVCSVSPELFFARRGERLLCRPMKGTAPRGRTSAEDRRAAANLHASPKDRAENLMIVDMVRNDLGRIARPGSVAVGELFRIERYPSLFQMTSDVAASSPAPLDELFAALFPCASVTGAPKVRTMELLAELETTPRGLYTGALGYVAPGGDARFSVAIRTAWCSPVVAGYGDGAAPAAARIEYGTGGGVVWDSTPGGELAESRTKVLALSRTEPAFELLETLLWQPPRPGRPHGYRLLARHLDRLADSAGYFDFAVERAAARGLLESAAAGFPPRAHRVRLLAGRRGELRIEAQALDPAGEPRPWRVALAERPVDESDRFLFHKTTRREVYARAFARAAGAMGAPGTAGNGAIDDVLLWNQAGELTETTRANLVLRLGGELLTPPVACGLLAGTARAELLDRGEIRERRLTRDDLLRADEILLVNSVRGWIPARLVASGGEDEPSVASRMREAAG